MKNIIIFAAGFAVGCFAAAYVINGKCERTVRSIDETTKKENKDVGEEISEACDKKKYSGIIKSEGYSENSDCCIISPEEFNDNIEYDIESLRYYADGVLANEDDEIIDNAESLVGKDFAKYFGEYEDDSVFVRNDRLKTYYEILRDLRTYSDILKIKPYLRR